MNHIYCTCIRSNTTGDGHPVNASDLVPFGVQMIPLLLWPRFVSSLLIYEIRTSVVYCWPECCNIRGRNKTQFFRRRQASKLRKRCWSNRICRRYFCKLLMLIILTLFCFLKYRLKFIEFWLKFISIYTSWDYWNHKLSIL